MKFNIVDRDTDRVVGAVSIDEGQFINAMEDRAERQEPKGRHEVVLDDGTKYSFNSFGEAFAFTVNGDARVKEDDYTDPNNLKSQLDRLARFDNWHNTEGEARNQFGEFKCICRGKFAIERLNGNQNNEQFIAFNTVTGEAKPFLDEDDARRWCYDSVPGTSVAEKLNNLLPGNPPLLHCLQCYSKEFDMRGKDHNLCLVIDQRTQEVLLGAYEAARKHGELKDAHYSGAVGQAALAAQAQQDNVEKCGEIAT